MQVSLIYIPLSIIMSSTYAVDKDYNILALADTKSGIGRNLAPHLIDPGNMYILSLKVKWLESNGDFGNCRKREDYILYDIANDIIVTKALIHKYGYKITNHGSIPDIVMEKAKPLIEKRAKSYAKELFKQSKAKV